MSGVGIARGASYDEVGTVDFGYFVRGLLVYAAVLLDKRDATAFKFLLRCERCNAHFRVVVRNLSELGYTMLEWVDSQSMSFTVQPVGPGSSDPLPLAVWINGALSAPTASAFPSGSTVLEAGKEMVLAGLCEGVSRSGVRGSECPICFPGSGAGLGSYPPGQESSGCRFERIG